MPRATAWSAGLVCAGLVLAASASAQTTTVLSPTGVAQGKFGAAIAGVPDLNGDLRADIILGAPEEGAAKRGRVHVVWGTIGVVIRSLDTPNPDFMGKFGFSVGGIPDVNGDGRGDIIVGAPGENPGSSPDDCGRAYIFSGSTGALLRTLQSPGQEEGGGFGWSVSGIPDVNGDGFGDVVVGAPFEDPGTSPDSVGRAYIYSGATGALLWKLFPHVIEADARFGISVAGVPDFTGDARGDVIVGTMHFAEEGRVSQFNGATGVRIRTVQSPGREPDGLFGFSVSGIPDVNGDGRGDFVVGAPGEDPGTSPANVGRAYIYNGATGQFLWKLLPLHAETDGNFGWSVAGTADLNGDMRGDVVVGAPGVDPGTCPTDCGRAYTYSGATGARLDTLFSLSSATNGRFGAAVGSITDVNLNGRAEVVVAATTEFNGGVRTGRVYLIRK